MACSCAWAAEFHFGLRALDRGQGIIDIALVFGMYLILTRAASLDLSPSAGKRSTVLAFVFMLLQAYGGGWLHAARYESFTNVFFYVLYYLNAFVGTWILYRALLACLFAAAVIVLILFVEPAFKNHTSGSKLRQHFCSKQSFFFYRDSIFD